MNIKALGIIAAVLVVVVWMSTYTVDQREKAILFSLGEIKKPKEGEPDIEPGLHWKLPFVNNARKFDGRILDLDAQPERFLTVEKKNVKVDFFVKWRIRNVARYYRATSGEERRAVSRLAQIVKDGLRNEFGKRTIQEAVSGERSEIMSIIEERANTQAGELGIEVVDVRISQINFPDDVSESVYSRMRAERQRVAKDFRARGEEAAERIRAAADRERTVLLAEAYREAERIRGDGDARSAELYANAYGKDEEFYAFYRSLSAYRTTFGQGNDMLVLEPDSDFFRYFNQSSVTPPARSSSTSGDSGSNQ